MLCTIGDYQFFSRDPDETLVTYSLVELAAGVYRMMVVVRALWLWDSL